MEWRRAVRNLGARFLFAATVVLALILGLSIHRFAWDRVLRHELVAHHFERSSWFAMNAAKYEELDPELAQRFTESAAWHAKRAREFQRMSDGEVVHQAEQDLEHDKDDGHLMERAATVDGRLAGRRGTPHETYRPRLTIGSDRDPSWSRALP